MGARRGTELYLTGIHVPQVPSSCGQADSPARSEAALHSNLLHDLIADSALLVCPRDAHVAHSGVFASHMVSQPGQPSRNPAVTMLQESA